MKKLLFILFLNIFSISIYGQNLTLSQILEIRKKDLGSAEEYLSAKGWEFYSGESPTETSMGSATFTYDKDEMSSRAQSFLAFLYSDYSNRTRISIQVNKKLKYNEYINAIKAYGCKIISSKIEDGKIVKVYRGATTSFIIKSGTGTNFFNEDTAVWFLLILSNEDYDLNFSD